MNFVDKLFKNILTSDVPLSTSLFLCVKKHLYFFNILQKYLFYSKSINLRLKTCKSLLFILLLQRNSFNQTKYITSKDS